MLIEGEWETLKQKIIWRDGGKCFICCSRQELSAHHIKPRDLGGKDEERNLITLCKKCHDYIEDESWQFILKMKEFKDEEKTYKYSKKERMKYGKRIDMYKLGKRGELIKIGERYEI